MAYIVTAYVVMAFIGMAYIVMAYVVMTVYSYGRMQGIADAYLLGVKPSGNLVLTLELGKLLESYY